MPYCCSMPIHRSEMAFRMPLIRRLPLPFEFPMPNYRRTFSSYYQRKSPIQSLAVPNRFQVAPSHALSPRLDPKVFGRSFRLILPPPRPCAICVADECTINYSRIPTNMMIGRFCGLTMMKQRKLLRCRVELFGRFSYCSIRYFIELYRFDLTSNSAEKRPTLRH